MAGTCTRFPPSYPRQGFRALLYSLYSPIFFCIMQRELQDAPCAAMRCSNTAGPSAWLQSLTQKQPLRTSTSTCDKQGMLVPSGQAPAQ